MEIQKFGKLATNLHDKTECFIIIRNLKQLLSGEFVLKKLNRIIKFNKKTWLKSYIDMNTDLRKKFKKQYCKRFFKLMNNAVFRKTTENMKKKTKISNLQQLKKEGII